MREIEFKIEKVKCGKSLARVIAEMSTTMEERAVKAVDAGSQTDDGPAENKVYQSRLPPRRERRPCRRADNDRTDDDIVAASADDSDSFYSSDEDERGAFSEGSAGSDYELIDCDVRVVEESTVDGQPRVQVVGTHAGKEFEVTIRPNLSLEISYDRQSRLFVPAYALLACLAASSALSGWLVFHGIPFLFSQSFSSSRLASMLQPRTLEDYGILWLAWHAIAYFVQNGWNKIWEEEKRPAAMIEKRPSKQENVKIKSY